MSYSEFTLGLDGLDTVTIFGVPTNCTVLPADVQLDPTAVDEWSRWTGASRDVSRRLIRATQAGLMSLRFKQ